MRNVLADNTRHSAEDTHWLSVSFHSNEETFTAANIHMPTSWAGEHDCHDAMAEVPAHLDEVRRKFGEHTILLAGDTNMELRDIEGDARHMLLREATTRHSLRGLAGILAWALGWRQSAGNYIENATDTILCTSASARTRTCTAATTSDHRVLVCERADRQAFAPRPRRDTRPWVSRQKGWTAITWRRKVSARADLMCSLAAAHT